MDLEEAIADLVEHLDIPTRSETAGRPDTPVEPRWRWSRRLAGVSVAAAAAVVVAVAFAVPESRSAVLRFFRTGSITITRHDTLPPATQRPLTSALGEPVAIPEAQRRLGVRLLLLPSTASPTGRLIFQHAYARPGVAALTYSTAHGRVVLTEVAYQDIDVVKKLIGPKTRIKPVRVSGLLGYWLTAAPHVLELQDETGRLKQIHLLVRGNVLVWQRHDLSLRLEGALQKREALRLAEQLR